MQPQRNTVSTMVEHLAPLTAEHPLLTTIAIFAVCSVVAYLAVELMTLTWTRSAVITHEELLERQRLAGERDARERVVYGAFKRAGTNGGRR